MTTIGPTKARLLRIFAVAAAAAGMQACASDHGLDLDNMSPEVRDALERSATTSAPPASDQPRDRRERPDTAA